MHDRAERPGGRGSHFLRGRILSNKLRKARFDLGVTDPQQIVLRIRNRRCIVCVIPAVVPRALEREARQFIRRLFCGELFYRLSWIGHRRFRLGGGFETRRQIRVSKRLGCLLSPSPSRFARHLSPASGGADAPAARLAFILSLTKWG